MKKIMREMPSNTVTKKYKILLIADEVIGLSLKKILEENGYEVNIVKSYGRFEEIYSELSRPNYDMLIPTNSSLSPEHILELIPVIKLKFPKMRILVLSGWTESDFIKDLKRLKIDDFSPLPIDPNELVAKVKELLNIDNYNRIPT